MWGKIFKIFSIIILILLISFAIFLFIYKDQIKVMNAVLDEDRETISHYIDEKDFNPNEIFGGINLIAFYLSEYKENRNLDFIKFLLDKKVDTNPKKWFATPLTLAIILNDHPLIELLIQNNANLNLITKKYSPLEIALVVNNCKTISLLHKNGAKINNNFEDWRLERLKNCLDK